VAGADFSIYDVHRE